MVITNISFHMWTWKSIGKSTSIHLEEFLKLIKISKMKKLLKDGIEY